jgi:predicted O-linked N-acetylglucosamine transferase (SPINDLY family)
MSNPYMGRPGKRSVTLVRIAKKDSAASSPDEVAWLIGWYRRQLALKPRETELRLKCGLFLLDLSRTDEAVTVLQEILRMDPNHLAAREALAQARSLGHGPPS